MGKKQYTFKDVEFCNMCGHSSSGAEVLGQRLNKSQGLNPKTKFGISTSVVRCGNCGLIYSNPQPIPSNIEDHYGVPPENYWTKEYFKVDEKYFLEEVSETKRLFEFKEGMKALDIGAGIGKCMIALERAGFEAYGLEPSASFRNKAINEMNIDAGKLKLGMIEEMDYPERFFDFITFGAVLEHLYDPSESIKRSLRWLKPGGVLHMEVPSADYFMSKVMNFYYKIRGTNYVTNISPMHEPFHLFEFGFKSFVEHSKKNNYEIASCKYFVGPIYRMPRVTHSVLRWYMGRTNKGMQMSLWLKKNT